MLMFEIWDDTKEQMEVFPNTKTYRGHSVAPPGEYSLIIHFNSYIELNQDMKNIRLLLNTVMMK